MNLHEIVSQLYLDTKDVSLPLFRPELVICAVVVLLLLLRIPNATRRLDSFYVALVGSGVALWFAMPWAQQTGERVEIFSGMLVYDPFTVYVRFVLLLFAVLFVIFTKLSGVVDREDGADIYTLVLGATLGMCLMASANHLLMVFMAVEMASVPSYVLAGMMKSQRRASEAALKYSVYGAGAAGVMLYGISLVAGVTGETHLPTMAAELSAHFHDYSAAETMALSAGVLMMMVGLAFKLSAFPFHFWCPDVFEGATAEVAAFLSVASKAAALALLVRVAIGLSGHTGAAPVELVAVVASAEMTSSEAAQFSVADEAPHDAENGSKASKQANEAAAPAKSATTASHEAPLSGFVAKLIALLAAVTCTFGNLAAYGQKNIKRLLAYSTIAHAGYMMMAVPPMLAMGSINPAGAERAAAALALYIAIYLFMNLGAFAVVAFLRNTMGSEEISDYAGLLRRCPGTVICFSLILFSLVGLPPLAGFLGKFAIFASLVDGYNTSNDVYLIVLLLIAGVNTAISLFYYLGIVRVMTMSPEPETRTPFSFPFVSLQGMFVFALTLPTIALMLQWNSLNELALAAARHLFS